jgi:hypothetical protein
MLLGMVWEHGPDLCNGVSQCQAQRAEEGMRQDYSPSEMIHQRNHRGAMWQVNKVGIAVLEAPRRPG